MSGKPLLPTVFLILASLPLGGFASEGAGEAAKLEVRFLKPEIPYLAGREEILVEIDLPAGDRLDRLDLFIDGKLVHQTRRQPYRFEHDFGSLNVSHTLLALAFSRAGRSGRAEFVSRTTPLSSHVEVQLVQLNVVVRDAEGHFVTSLDRDDFTILEEGVEQNIAVFEKGDTPCSVALALDSSGSMKHLLWRAQKAAGDFLRRLPSNYEVSVLGFNDTVFLSEDFTNEKRPLIYAINHLQAEGSTALYEAIRAASLHLGTRPNRKAVVLFTDGQESIHRRDETGEQALTDVLEVANRSEVTFFAIGYGDTAGRDILARIAEETGGKLFSTRTHADLNSFYEEISRNLNSQYTLAYYPVPDPPPGKWRSLEVLVHREGMSTRTRKGYRADRR